MKKIVAFILLMCVILSVAACTPAQDPREEKYAEAYELLEAGNYEEAYELFLSLGDYKEAAKEAAHFRYMPMSHRGEYPSDEGNEYITYTVTLNDKNLPATVVKEYSSGLKHTCSFKYNELGYTTHRECSDSEGNTTVYEATFDAKGNFICETFTNTDGNTSRFDYTYSEDGLTFTAVTTNAPGYYKSYISTLDAEGREIKVVFEYEDGITIEENTYNEAGNILKKTWSKENSEPYSIYDYIYDEKGNLLEILFTDDGEDGGFRRLTYDANGRMIKEHILYSFGYECISTFEYDDHGNVIRATFDNADDDILDGVTQSTYKLVYIPYDITEADWEYICDSTQCMTMDHSL